jgi:hypothetical protein
MSRMTLTLEIDDAAQEVLLRCYHAFLQEMSALALAAPDGQVVDQLEELALGQGRDTLRATLEQAVQQRIVAAEKKRPRSAPAPAANAVKTAAPPFANS